MKIILPVLSILILICFYKCTSSKEANTKNELQLYFGSGGGFTGFVTQYRLFPDGTIQVHKTKEPEWKPLFKIEKSLAQQYFRQIKQLDLLNESFSKPDNRYFFIKVVDFNQENKITWGGQSNGLKKEISILYKILNNHVVEFYKQNSKK